MAIVTNKNTGDLYRYFGDNKFKNLRTGIEGLIETELARKIFVINLDATKMLNSNENIEYLIKELNLKTQKK